jgi:hypothetical protein
MYWQKLSNDFKDVTSVRSRILLKTRETVAAVQLRDLA